MQRVEDIEKVFHIALALFAVVQEKNRDSEQGIHEDILRHTVERENRNCREGGNQNHGDRHTQYAYGQYV